MTSTMRAERHALDEAIDHIPIEHLRVLTKIASSLSDGPHDVEMVALRALHWLAREHADMAKNLGSTQMRCSELLNEKRGAA